MSYRDNIYGNELSFQVCEQKTSSVYLNVKNLHFVRPPANVVQVAALALANTVFKRFFRSFFGAEFKFLTELDERKGGIIVYNVVIASRELRAWHFSWSTFLC